MPTHTLVNGCYSNTVAADDRGFAYGDGVFETIKLEHGRAEFLDQHLQRLQWGCKRLRIRCDFTSIRYDISRLLLEKPCASGIIKVIITRGQSGRGYKADFAAVSNRIVSVQAMAMNNLRQQNQGVATTLCDTRLSINPVLAGLKHLSRLENVLARSEWDSPDIDEGLMLDTEGRLIEGTMSNLFLVRGEKLMTPSLHRCGVEGVIRQVIIERLLPLLNRGWEITDLSINDIYHADEIFLCNSLIGIWPVIAIGCHKKSVGSVTIDIQQALRAEVLLAGKE